MKTTNTPQLSKKMNSIKNLEASKNSAGHSNRRLNDALIKIEENAGSGRSLSDRNKHPQIGDRPPSFLKPFRKIDDQNLIKISPIKRKY